MKSSFVLSALIYFISHLFYLLESLAAMSVPRFDVVPPTPTSQDNGDAFVLSALISYVIPRSGETENVS